MYLIPAFLCFAIWIGVGLAGLMDILDQRFRRIGVAGGLILIVYLFVLAGNHWRQVDASRDLRAERFGGEVLAQVPRNAIVFAEGDKAIFAMWYFHYALKERSDLVVVATGLLSFDWYQESLLTAYPGLKLSVPFPFSETVAEENPGRSVCFIEYVETAKIDCLPAQDSKLP